MGLILENFDPGLNLSFSKVRIWANNVIIVLHYITLENQPP